MNTPHTSRVLLTAALAALLLASCKPRISEEARQAQELARTAEARVAALEKALADAKAGRPAQGGGATVQENPRELERRLEQARTQAAERRKEAQALAAAPSAPGAPAALVLELPRDTQLQVKLSRELATDRDAAGSDWEGSLASPVTVGGETVWPAGTRVRGTVVQSAPAGRLVGGKGALGLRVTEVGTHGVQTGVHTVQGESRAERNTKFIGGGAAVGALVGVLSDRKNQGDHALGGAALGAAAGTALAAGTADTVIRIPAGKVVGFKLAEPEKVVLRK